MGHRGRILIGVVLGLDWLADGLCDCITTRFLWFSNQAEVTAIIIFAVSLLHSGGIGPLLIFVGWIQNLLEANLFAGHLNKPGVARNADLYSWFDSVTVAST
ncbi:hypothetical protein OIU74_028871 [Salix koriyanagi]|uniref:Uncharacterized protein n=1 Tax=Salix koriyanagi TaxID=2511006 RepID=A0A9Q0ZTE8_9ROSI|nr:hypothetical protein OIU74_028871 [Salix koriyanagi]